MITRILLIVVAGTLLSACVDSERSRSSLGGPPPPPVDQRDPRKQTMASKVLGAIALERVTGRKPDPGRLNERRL
jgi:hypothetical protein